LPSSFCACRRDGGTLSGGQPSCSLFSAAGPEFGGGTLNGVQFLGFLAGRDPHDADGVADHVSRALLSLWAARHH